MEGRPAAREHAALQLQAGGVGRFENAQARNRVVAREDHHGHALAFGRVEGQQLLHQREGDAGPRRLVHAFELQAHVGGIVLVLEDAVFLLEIEQRARGERDDELAFEAGGHPRSPPDQTQHGSPRLQAASR